MGKGKGKMVGKGGRVKDGVREGLTVGKGEGGRAKGGKRMGGVN